MSLREFNNFLEQILPSLKKTDVFDKKRNLALITVHTLNRLQSLFRYKNLPSTIPARYLEMYLQMNGNCCIAEVNGSLYALVGSFGGEPDAYYLPQEYVVANPYLKLTKVYKRDVDCIVLMNDPYMMGLLPIIHKYGAQMAETELSMNMSVINARIMSLITGTTDNDVEAANKFIEDIKEGKLTAVASDAFFEGIKVQPYANSAQSNALTDLIEMEQYLKAGLLNDLGLNANYNMKRESLNSNESQLNDDMLSPLVDLMLKTRKDGINAVNEMFGTEIEVDFDSAWKENKVEHDITLVSMAEGLSGTASETDPEEEPETDPEEEPEVEQEEEQDIEQETEQEESKIEEVKEKVVEELLELLEEPEEKEEGESDENI